jgi:putative (di)nucleoside polyphosphate hydrolase
MTNTAPPPLPFELRPWRLGVGIVLLNARGEAFVGHRADTPGPAWQFPQGGIDDGETPRIAALREMKEEVGTDNAEYLAETADWIAYDLPQDLADRVWRGRYRGQKQKWFAFRFLGTDSDIRLDAHVREFDDWRWMKLAEVPATIVAFKRPLYDQVVAELLPVAERLARGG